MLDGSTVSPLKSYVRQERVEKAALSSHLAKCLLLPASRRFKASGEMFFAAHATLTISFFLVFAALSHHPAATFRACCKGFFALVVIPSILNLTSSHSRDEVIAKNARHVRRALIGWWRSGGGVAYGASDTVANLKRYVMFLLLLLLFFALFSFSAERVF